MNEICNRSGTIGAYAHIKNKKIGYIPNCNSYATTRSVGHLKVLE